MLSQVGAGSKGTLEEAPSENIEFRYCPVPDKYTVCGLLLALSFTTTLAVLVARSLGVKVTLIVQLEPEPKDAGQLFV